MSSNSPNEERSAARVRTEPLSASEWRLPNPVLFEGKTFDLHAVARWQRRYFGATVGAILVYCCGYMITRALPSTAANAFDFSTMTAFLVLLGWMIYCMIRLCYAFQLDQWARVFFVGLVFFPPFFLLTIAWFNYAAIAILQEGGVRGAWLWVSEERAKRYLDTRRCRSCEYDLTGNVSGRCPECGADVINVRT